MNLRIGLYGNNIWNLREMEMALQFFGEMIGEKVRAKRFTDLNLLELELEKNRIHVLFIDGEWKSELMRRWLERQDGRQIPYCIVDYWEREKERRKPPFHHFLEKPIQMETFLQMVSRMVEEYLQKNRGQYQRLMIKHNYRDLSIPCMDITYISKIREEFIVHTWSGDAYNSYGAMKNLMDRLPQDSFFATTRGCIINLRYVTVIDEKKVGIRHMESIETLPVCRNRSAELREAKQRYDGKERKWMQE